MLKLTEIKISREKENHLRDLISRQEALREILLRQGIRTCEDPDSLLLTANFFFHVEDYTKWLEYNERIIDEFPYSKACMQVGENLRFVKENCIVN